MTVTQHPFRIYFVLEENTISFTVTLTSMTVMRQTHSISKLQNMSGPFSLILVEVTTENGFRCRPKKSVLYHFLQQNFSLISFAKKCDYLSALRVEWNNHNFVTD